ncbi:MAG: radical SAM protein [Chitinivibrionales bacterium]|nr:radical SAM protein [Chitinivibrionales bacterium]
MVAGQPAQRCQRLGPGQCAGDHLMADGPKKRYRLLLITPRLELRHPWNLQEISELMGKKVFSYPLGLPTVAALTPDHYDIRIVNEEVEEIPFDDPVDIVGVTTMVPTIQRAYEIVDTFRARGVPVVMGGTYATFNTDEVLEHASAVVVGEAEGAWQRCLQEFESGSMQRVYHAEETPAFTRSPPPRWDLIDTDRLLVLGVQVSRGCPYRCEFCLVSKMFGNRMRYRELDDVIAEIEQLPKKQLFFVDDNLTANKAYARELMQRLAPLRVSWSCQASIDVAYDTELLRAMADAGCSSILIGFESVDPSSLAETRKFHNRIQRYEEAIANVHAAGMQIIGAFIVGFDADTAEAFDHIYRFTTRNNISQVMLSTLTVLPGTDLRKRMGEEGRLVDADPRLINGVYPCMRYHNFTPEALFRGYFDLLERVYDYELLEKKGRALFENGAFAEPVRCPVPLSEKLRVSVTILFTFILTLNAPRRRLFLRLFPLASRGLVSFDKLFIYLLFMEAFHRYPIHMRSTHEKALGLIRRFQTDG